MQNTELRRRARPVLDALRTLALQGRTPVLGLRKKSCPYHSWDTVQEDPATAPGWTPFAPGDAIGGVEAHYCFRGGITAPAGSAGRHLVCLVSTGATDIWNNNNPQFLAYLNGTLVCGLDVNHTEFDLSPAAAESQTWQLGLYAYCNTPAQDVFLKVETAVRDDEITGLYYDLKAPYEVLVQLDEGDTNAIGIGRYLEKALDMLDLRDPYSAAFYASVAAARRYMKEEFYESFCQRQPITVDCVGHTHIDVAWLWTLAQTREKAIRSFATVNYLMDRYPEYKFLSSQPQLYDFVRKDCPALFEKIRARVADGHWEPEGGMWLESDCNMASGESLIRQFLHGQEFFGREFGKQGHILWLPDAFGFSGALPQIMAQCGMDWFMTTKMAWNDTNCMPHDLTRWRGIDGTEVLAYFISTKDYDKRPDRNPKPSFNTTYNGLLMDALANTAIEQVCDKAEQQIQETMPNRYFTWRFSPGYGDFPISEQPNLLAHLNAARQVGIITTETYLMNPRKSVSAIFGCAHHPLPKRRQGCSICKMRETCAFRKKGAHCGGTT